MNAWSKTLADEPELTFGWRADRNKPFDATSPHTMVIAPCCGRRTPADTVVDLRAIPGTMIRGGNWRLARDLDWACDGCVHLLYADPSNDWTKSKLLEARGAPAALVLEHRARERADERRRQDDAAGRPHRPMEAHAESLAALQRQHQDALLASVTSFEELNTP